MCYTVKDAVLTAQLAREALEQSVEVIRSDLNGSGNRRAFDRLVQVFGQEVLGGLEGPLRLGHQTHRPGPPQFLEPEYQKCTEQRGTGAIFDRLISFGDDQCDRMIKPPRPWHRDVMPKPSPRR